MKCEQCDEPATVHLTVIGESGPCNRHLCEQHATVEGAVGPEAAPPEHITVLVEVTGPQIDRKERLTVSLPNGEQVDVLLFPGIKAVIVDRGSGPERKLYSLLFRADAPEEGRRA